MIRDAKEAANVHILDQTKSEIPPQLLEHPVAKAAPTAKRIITPELDSSNGRSPTRSQLSLFC